jgi:hypothetical protein
MNTSLKALLLLSLLYQTGLEAKDGWRDHGNERECHVEEPPGVADGPVLHLVIAGTTGKRPLLVHRPLVEGVGQAEGGRTLATVEVVRVAGV